MSEREWHCLNFFIQKQFGCCFCCLNVLLVDAGVNKALRYVVLWVPFFLKAIIEVIGVVRILKSSDIDDDPVSHIGTPC